MIYNKDKQAEMFKAELPLLLGLWVKIRLAGKQPHGRVCAMLSVHHGQCHNYIGYRAYRSTCSTLLADLKYRTVLYISENICNISGTNHFKSQVPIGTQPWE